VNKRNVALRPWRVREPRSRGAKSQKRVVGWTASGVLVQSWSCFATRHGHRVSWRNPTILYGRVGWV